MRKAVIGLIVLLVLGLVLAGCDNGTTTETKVVYGSILPEKDYTSLKQLIAEEEGAFFQNSTRSLRFFDNGELQVFNVGLFMAIQSEAAFGSKYKIDGDTIRVYRSTDADTSPFYTITFTLTRHTLEIVSKTEGVEAAPNDTNLPLGKYSYGKVPYYRPGTTYP